MIVSHVLRQVLLLDPFGGASEPYGIDSVQNSYIGYNVSTCPERLQTDRWNCGVWVAWVGPDQCGRPTSKEDSRAPCT